MDLVCWAVSDGGLGLAPATIGSHVAGVGTAESCEQYLVQLLIVGEARDRDTKEERVKATRNVWGLTGKLTCLLDLQ